MYFSMDFKDWLFEQKQLQVCTQDFQTLITLCWFPTVFVCLDTGNLRVRPSFFSWVMRLDQLQTIPKMLS